ncbi:PREDICTED: uncharacterized protein LOC104724424 [Camelina sativa]|uniref:Uncharacterized protein LOC104724424 n=1 Tax=Camelina sativa TaxID=90675 RepID=A0ABM0UHG5_CAMSA|nr:PREDICTED: uncharacterized protein LOC104724424 [Camelina sativa]
MARRHLSFAILLIGLALAGGAHAAGSSSPSPPATSSNTTEKSPPTTLEWFNSTTSGQDYSDYEVPMDLAPDGVEVVEDYVPISVNESNDDDQLAQPEGDSDKKTNQPKDSDSSSSSSYSSYSSSFAVFIVAAGLFLF